MSICARTTRLPYYLVSYERDVIRPRALGKFEDLLEATAHSPAMLLYLDNASSIGPDSLAAERAKFVAARRPDAKKKVREGLNENYARELMELHTLGVNGGYTQADVTQVARILTGWTVDRPQRGGGFRFEPNRHEPGTKNVLGKKFKENGERKAASCCTCSPRVPPRRTSSRASWPSASSATIRRRRSSIAWPNPILSSGGDISAVLKTLFHSPEFWSTHVYRAKVKTPLEFVVSAVRASNADITILLPARQRAARNGHAALRLRSAHRLQMGASDWVSTRRARQPHELCSLARRQPPARHHRHMESASDSNGAADAVVGQSRQFQSRNPRSRVSNRFSSPAASATRRAPQCSQQFQQQSAQMPERRMRRGSVPAAMQFPRQDPAAGRYRRARTRKDRDQLLAGLLLGSPEFQRR